MTDATPVVPRGRRRARAATFAAAAALAVTVLAVPLARATAPDTARSDNAGADRAGAVADAAALRQANAARAAAAVHAAATAASTPIPIDGGGMPWRVGFAKESLDPPASELAPAAHDFHLGGYGIFPTRQSTGPMIDTNGQPEHIYARAMAVTDHRHHTMLLAAIENQGTFTADKQGPYGIWDMRRAVSRKTHVPVDMIVINSDHSHAGPDLIGLWGGVPIAYLKEVYARTVAALEEAYDNEQPAQLLVGTSIPTMPTPAVGGYIPGTASPGEHLVHSQFSPDTQTGYDDSAVDTQLRVLQAVAADGKTMLGTLINYAAHATVMGGGNLLYSADWPGRVAQATEQALNESVAVTMVADVGRSQPPRPHSDVSCDKAGHPSCDLDQLDTYTSLLTQFGVLPAVNAAVPVTGTDIEGREVLTREEATNPALIGVSYTGEVPVRGYGAYRSATLPWFTGTVLGAFASAHRIGNVLLTANPGEAYPDIRFGVSREISGEQAFFTFGLANDQLGYLIAPTTEYGWITTSNVGNDNSFFNVAPQYGDHLMCTETALAVEVGFTATGNAAPYGSAAPAPVCPVLTASDLVPMGPAVQQPWPFGDGVRLPSPFPQ